MKDDLEKAGRLGRGKSRTKDSRGGAPSLISKKNERSVKGTWGRKHSQEP